jgi:hypothetical protein
MATVLMVYPQEDTPLLQPNWASSSGAKMAKELIAAELTSIASQAPVTTTHP